MSPVGASAQSLLAPPPATIPSDRKFTDTDKRKVMADYAACTLRLSRRGVERYLATAPGSKAARDLADRLLPSDCLAGGEIAFSETSYRAAAYDALYRMEFAKGGPLDFSGVAQIEYAQEAPGLPAGTTESLAALRKLADCAVRKNPGDARQLILSSVGSEAETGAFSALVPSISQCLTSTVTLKFSKFTLRGYVGETLYRLSAAAKKSTAGG